MSEITLIQDLAQKNLQTVPKNVLNMTNLKMLYLEGNNLSELPGELFIILTKLQWLDVRNNKLECIPTSIMHHSSLQTLLLQNNDIEMLPLELGFVPNLKMLQLLGNPIRFPKKSVIEGGILTITKYLRNKYLTNDSKSDNLNTETDETRPSDTTITTDFSMDNQQSDSDLTPDMPIITLKSFHRIHEKKSRSKPKRISYKSRSKYSMYKETPFCNSNRYVNCYPVRKNESRIQDQIMKDIFLKKMQELMIDQEEILQKEKDRETMSSWKFNPKYKNKKPDTNYRLQVPYDFNKDYNRIPSRKDLNNFIERSSHSTASIGSKKINVEKLIGDIVESLKIMERERNIEKTPRAQMDYAGREIKRILELQKRLSALKIANFNSV